MKHFYALLAALVCTPLLAQKPAQLPNRLSPGPQHELELRQHMAQSQNKTRAQELLAKSAVPTMVRDYEEMYDNDNQLQAKNFYTYDDSGNVTIIERFNYALSEGGVIWEGEMTAVAWESEKFRFSDYEGYLPSISDEVYDALVGKTMHLVIKSVEGESSPFRVMNGWWSNVYYELEVHSGETLDFLFTQEMCDECKEKDLCFLSMESEITISKLYFDADEKAQDKPESKTEYTYDDRGNITSIVDYRQANGELVYTRKSEYAYDAKGYQILNADYYWENDAWVCSYKNEQLFDENGRHIGSINFNQYWTSTKTENVFDDNGTETGYLSYLWRDDQWTLDSKTDYIFNDEGVATGTLGYVLQDDKWVATNKYDYTYAENGLLKSYIYSLWINDEWDVVGKVEYIYDENDRNTSYTRYNWIEGEWVGSEKYEYAYDENGFQTSYAAFEWRNGEWAGSNKTESIYDANGMQTLRTTYYWIDGAWVVNSQSKNDIEYNDNGNIVSSTNYYYLGAEDVWYNSGKEEYTYDENNNASKLTQYTWRGNEWVIARTYVYHYIPFEQKDAASISSVVEEGTGINGQNATAAPAYTLQGIRSNAATKGLMIKNGKKLYVK